MSKTASKLKPLLASICAILSGWGMQSFVSPDAQDLEAKATAAWNSGDVSRAEQLARRAIRKSPKSTRAYDVLTQVAHHNGRPDLLAAVTDAKFVAQGRPVDGALNAGDVAFGSNLNRLAEIYWERALAIAPNDSRIHQRLTTLAGVRLSHRDMQRRLLEWSKTETPNPDLVLLYLGLSSLDERDAVAAAGQLMAGLEADSNDFETRIGLGRCLLAMGRYQQCLTLLQDRRYSHNIEAIILRATALAFTGKPVEAAAALSQPPSDEAVGEYHFAQGLIAELQEDWPMAAEHFASAVQHQPLSRLFRSRLCDTLRRSDDVDRQRNAVDQLEMLLEIIETSAAGTDKINSDTYARLTELCEGIGAVEAVEILQQITK